MSGKKRHNYKNLKIWLLGIEIAKDVSDILILFPKHEQYDLGSQMNRCSVSIPSNIAEGSGRTTNKEFVRFLEIAISSSYELETQLILINDLFNVDTDSLIQELTVLQNKIGGFIRKMRTEIEK